MLADTVEAACHTLENPTSQRLEKFITTLVNAKMDTGQLNNSELTFKDIAKIKESFVNLLTGYYHNRIKYQNQVDPDDKKDAPKDATGEKKLVAKDITGEKKLSAGKNNE